MRQSTISTQVNAPTLVAALTSMVRISLRRNANAANSSNKENGFFSKWRKRSRSRSSKPERTSKLTHLCWPLMQSFRQPEVAFHCTPKSGCWGPFRCQAWHRQSYLRDQHGTAEWEARSWTEGKTWWAGLRPLWIRSSKINSPSLC